MTVVVVPELKGLAVNDTAWVWFAVISVIRTTIGVQVILGFQENSEPVTA